jgi:hypothetical protein
VFVGQIADGDTCYSQYDCAATSYCDLIGACAGACKPKKTAGQSASIYYQCQSGLGVIAGVCTAPSAIGASCASSYFCVTGAACDGTLCQPTKKSGESCADPDIAGSTGSCGGLLACQHGVCGVLAPLGQSCFHPSGFKIQHADCERDLWCDDQDGNATGTCKQPLPQSSPCADDYDCVAGLTCIGASGGSQPVAGQCVPLLGLNASCTFWSQCQPTLYCAGATNQQTCVARKASGACTYFFECASNSCTNAQCDPVCAS